MKDFHSGPNSQNGASLVVLLVGLALSAISVAAASAFFIQSNVKAKAIMGESESVTHLALLLKQAFNSKHCLKLDVYKGKFRKTVAGPEVLSDESILSAAAAVKASKPSSFNSNSLSILNNSVGRSYDISRVQMVQRTGIIGRDPGRVLADLKIEVVYKAKVSKRESDGTQVLTVPLLLDVDNTFQAIGCMQTPIPMDLCTKNNGTFDGKSTSQICNIKKR